MKTEMKDFLAEGLKNYKKASSVMMEFFINTQDELQAILKKRNKWGSAFKPKETTKVKSTKFWDKYPLINALIPGDIEGKAVQIKIAINWHDSKSDYPFYAVYLVDGPDVIYEKISTYKKRGRFDLKSDERGLIMDPNPEDFNLERDFNILIDEFVKIL
jgi:hypothetical protein